MQNDEGAYRGLIPLTTATTFSDNTVFAQLALRIGTERIRRVAHLMGIARPIGADPAIALGGLRHCCTPIEMALAYSTLANEGVRVTGSLPVRRPGPGEVPDPTLTPIAIRRVEDASGHVIDRNKPQKAQVVSRESALHGHRDAAQRHPHRHGAHDRGLPATRRPARPARPRTSSTPGSSA